MHIGCKDFIEVRQPFQATPRRCETRFHGFADLIPQFRIEPFPHGIGMLSECQDEDDL